MMTRHTVRHAAALACLAAVWATPHVQARHDREPNVAVAWNDALLRAIADDRTGPPQAARALAVLQPCSSSGIATARTSWKT
jgi:hypothetical protein